VPLRELEESRIAAGRSTLVASWGVKADAESGRVAVALVMADGDVCGFVADLDGDTIQ
jgi:hypothetical protein